MIYFSDFVSFPLNCFKVFGLVPQGNQPMNKKTKIFFEVWRFLGFTSLILPFLFVQVYIKEKKYELSAMAEGLPTNGYLVMVLVKIVCVYRKKKCFKKVLEILEDLFPKTRDEQNIFKVKNYWKSYKRIEQTVSISIVISVFSFPVGKIASFCLTGVWYDGKLPATNWFPFDESQPTGYNFVIVWQFVCSFWLVGGMLGSDFILFSLVSLVSMHFDILAQELEKLKSDEKKQRFVELIEQHEKLLKLSKDLEEIFSPSILFNFTASSFFICLVGYQVSLRISFDLMIKFSFLLIASLLQVLSLCSCGQKLSTAAEQVAFATYSFDWTPEQKKMKTTMVMVMQRAQKRTVLTACKFSLLNLEAFTVVSTCR
jgi:hypothetical protein